ncbi:MAG: carboxypeptidase regulatory-like domain-containing protein [Saprospiraceae bacterium]|nr:carboxypeptidase regulatory-like domain-containing protein [Saprospiraceae bacterium]
MSLIIISLGIISCGDDDLEEGIRVLVINDSGEPQFGVEVYVVHVPICEVSDSYFTDETGIAFIENVQPGKNIFLARSSGFSDVLELTIGDSPPEEITMIPGSEGGRITFLLLEPRNPFSSPGEELTFILDVRDEVFVQKALIEVFDENDKVILSGFPEESGNFVFDLVFQEKRSYFLRIKATNLLGESRERQLYIENVAPPRLTASVKDSDGWCVTLEWNRYSRDNFQSYDISSNYFSENYLDKTTGYNVNDINQTSLTMNRIPLYDTISFNVEVQLNNGVTSAPLKPVLKIPNPIPHLFDFYFQGNSLVDNGVMITQNQKPILLYNFNDKSSTIIDPFQSNNEIRPLKSVQLDNIPVVPIASGQQELAFVSPITGSVIGYHQADYDITDDFGYFSNGTFAVRVYDDKEYIGIYDIKTGEERSMTPHLNDVRGDLWMSIPENNQMIVFATYENDQDAIIYQFDGAGILESVKAIDLPWQVNNQVDLGNSNRYIVTKFEGYVLDVENDLEFVGSIPQTIGVKHVAFDKYSSLYTTTSFVDDSIRVFDMETMSQVESLKGPAFIEHIQIENRRLYIGMNTQKREGVAIMDL